MIASLACIGVATAACAQTSALPESPPAPKGQPEHERSAVKEASFRPAGIAPGVWLRNVAHDQKDIWTSPFKIRMRDLNWLAPLAGVTAGLISADSELSSRFSNPGTSSGLLSHSNTASTAGVGVLLAAPGGLYLLGKGDAHRRETGILAYEAALDGLLVTGALKVVTARERPLDGTGRGNFLVKGGSSRLNGSFPSVHSVLAWSSATVLAHEYPGTMTKVFAYGVAAGVSAARVTGKDHFPSDVLVGSGLGFLIGRQVYARHHDPELRGNGWGSFKRSPASAPETQSTQNIASPYVPLDSWVYAAFDRMSALGVIHSGMMGLKPWTRRECARLLEEAAREIDETSPNEAARLYSALAKQFAPDLEDPAGKYIGVDSLYARATGITGAPLTDGYHFGQTIVNDYGRPYQRGVNSVDGFSGSSSIGMLGFYVRGEFQHAPSAPGVSQAVQDAIQFADRKPFGLTASPIAAANQFRLLDTYVMLHFKGWQASFGKQSLWTGPTQDPFLSSNNAEPMYMFRLDKTSPGKIPLLGAYRLQFWFGKLSGQHFVDTQDGHVEISLVRPLERQPMINGQKITFKPTPDFEFSLGKTGLFGGPRFPVTLGTFWASVGVTTNACPVGCIHTGPDPGDRRSTFDFTYRIPGLRKWLVLYEDSFVEDEITPIGYPRRAAHSPGLYLPQLPKLRHVDLRVEASYTNLPNLLETRSGGFFYWNTRYLDGYTNNGNIIGNGTVGRQGIAFRGETTYWFAADKRVQLGYRNAVADTMFLEGGNLRDVYVRSEWKVRPGLSLSSFLQYEWWNFPLLSAGNRQKNLTTSFQLTYWPHWRLSSAN